MSQRTFDEALVQVADVQGWMSPDQAERLYRAAASTRPGDQIVEIGSFQGRSTIVLASAAPAEVPVVAIDPHAGNDRGPQEIEGFAEEAQGDHERFNANLVAAAVADHVRHVRAFSDTAHAEVQGEIAVLYIDGAHRYAPARTDIRDWGARVTPGGTMLIHDSFSSVGVTLAILRELMVSGRWRYVGRARSLTEFRADLDGTPKSRALNALRLAAQLPWFAKNLLIKVLITVKLGGVLRAITGREPEWPY
ncbi:MAG: class I SAM-dependent methyltransferase [Ilumatobacteraceae bacterium]